MSSASIAETKNNLSAILANLLDGSEQEHLIKNRNKPVAVIVPFGKAHAANRTFGYAKNDGRTIDWEAFDAMDAEIEEMFGV